MGLFMFRRAHSTLTNEYPKNGAVKWGGSSSWWAIETRLGYR